MITKDASPIVGHFGAKYVISSRHHLSKSPSRPPWVTSRGSGCGLASSAFGLDVLVSNQTHFLTYFACVWVWWGLWLSSILWFISFLALTWSVKDSAYKLWSSMNCWALSAHDLSVFAFQHSIDPDLTALPMPWAVIKKEAGASVSARGFSIWFCVYWSWKFECVKVMFITSLRDWVVHISSAR